MLETVPLFRIFSVPLPLLPTRSSLAFAHDRTGAGDGDGALPNGVPPALAMLPRITRDDTAVLNRRDCLSLERQGRGRLSYSRLNRRRER